jgi:hypothetical protein
MYIKLINNNKQEMKMLKGLDLFTKMTAVSNTVPRLITGKYAIFVRLSEILKWFIYHAADLKIDRRGKHTHQLQNDANFQEGEKEGDGGDILQVYL